MRDYKDKEYFDKIDLTNIPRHLAIIMDGNGRWATKRTMPRTYGHYQGAKNVITIVRTSSDLGVKDLSLYAFSAENWQRPAKEVDIIMGYIVKFIDDYIDELTNENVHLRLFGQLEGLPSHVKNKVSYALERTSKNNGMNLNMCLNYGGRQEIIRAAKNLAQDYKDGLLGDLSKLGEKEFEAYLYSEESSSVDLLIRPSGELRVSNFLLYQIAYSEFYFSDVLWPDFDEVELFKAILSFQNRDRRFGGLNE